VATIITRHNWLCYIYMVHTVSAFSHTSDVKYQMDRLFSVDRAVQSTACVPGVLKLHSTNEPYLKHKHIRRKANNISVQCNIIKDDGRGCSAHGR